MQEKIKPKTIEIQAIDTLFFRDARPFTMGDEAGAKGIFPPAPSVLYGALRSAYLTAYPKYVSKAGTNEDPTNNLRITAIALKRGDDIVLPLPCDLVKKKHPDEPEKEIKQKLYTVYQLKREAKTDSALLSSLPAEHILRFHTDEVVENLEDGLITTLLFQRYVDGRFKQGDVRKREDCVKDEPKIGIARHDVTRSSQEGALYRVEMQRPEVLKSLSEQQLRDSPHFRKTTVSFLVQIQDLEQVPEKFPEHGLVRFGGEGKAASFRQIDDPFTINTPQIDPTCFKVYLATPAVFANGWLPGCFKQVSGNRHKVWRGTLANGAQLTLLAAAVGRYQPAGGFDMVKRMPKPLQRLVPAGSVYYFHLDKGEDTLENAVKKVFEAFDQKAISDSEEYRKQGFGISYIAREGA